MLGLLLSATCWPLPVCPPGMTPFAPLQGHAMIPILRMRRLRQNRSALGTRTRSRWPSPWGSVTSRGLLSTLVLGTSSGRVWERPRPVFPLIGTKEVRRNQEIAGKQGVAGKGGTPLPYH